MRAERPTRTRYPSRGKIQCAQARIRATPSIQDCRGEEQSACRAGCCEPSERPPAFAPARVRESRPANESVRSGTPPLSHFGTLRSRTPFSGGGGHAAPSPPRPPPRENQPAQRLASVPQPPRPPEITSKPPLISLHPKRQNRNFPQSRHKCDHQLDRNRLNIPTRAPVAATLERRMKAGARWQLSPDVLFHGRNCASAY